jgi:LysM repeat protein
MRNERDRKFRSHAKAIDGMKKLYAVVCFLLLSLHSSGQLYEAADVENYIATYKEVAIEEMTRTGIPASITLAQGIIESGAGKSPLAVEANNHFGIKCHETWKGATYTYDDDRKNECFRKYDSTLQSFYDHSDFLKTRSRYAVLFTYSDTDYKSWAKGLKACGYATNPQYAEVLIKCIEDYDLHQWDLKEEDRAAWFAQINKSDTNQSSSQQLPAGEDDAWEQSLEKVSASERIYVFNDITCVNLPAGESLNQLATKYEIGMKRLLRYNDAADASQIQAGDRVYLQPKRSNGDQKFHTVREGETMFSISQLHGIQLVKLYQKNLMTPGTEPVEGTVLNLRDTREEAPDTLAAKATDTSTKVIAQPKASTAYYTVNKGDTLYSISKRYHLTVDELKQMNQLASSDLQVGDKLRVK